MSAGKVTSTEGPWSGQPVGHILDRHKVGIVSTRCHCGGALASVPVRITSASYAYPRVDASGREAVARAVASRGAREGVFLLTTCLRLEVAVAGGVSLLDRVLDELVGATDVQPVVRTGLAAVTHLFRVAAGLESPVPGEVEVLTQFRQALTSMKDQGDVDSRMTKLLEAAVATGRDTRSRLPAPHRSMATVVAEMMGSRRRVAVVGSGAMARAVVESLGDLSPTPSITVVARSPSSVPGHVEEVLGMDGLPSVLVDADVVVSATAASTRLLDGDSLDRLVHRRPAPLTLIDLAMPPDFSSPISDRVRYLGIDDVARRADQDLALDEAERHVSRAAASWFQTVTNHDRSGPLIASMFASADRVVDDTVQRFAGRLTRPEDREVLYQTARTVARTLLNRPVSVVRSSPDPEVADMVSSVFIADD